MVDVHRLPDRKEIERVASEWVARLNADDVSAGERAAFETWRTAHSWHACAYAELNATWNYLTQAGPRVRAVSSGQAMNMALPTARRRWQRWVAAGVLALCIGAAWQLWPSRPDEVFQTLLGEHAKMALQDGSSVELNSDSRVSIRYRAHARMVRLEHGEAFFSVAHDARRPFWVVAGGAWVRAVGTAFTVYLRPAGLQVTVSEGAVKVAAQRSGYQTPSDDRLTSGPVFLLSTGERANVNGGSSSIEALGLGEMARSMAWRDGEVHFERQSLKDVIAEMRRYTPLQISINDNQLSRLTIGGVFQTSPAGAEALLTLLHDGLGLNVRRDNDGHVNIEPRRSKE